MSRPIFIKLGGSILTDKTTPESLNQAALTEVVELITAVRRSRPDLPLLIGHGGGSFGHYWADRYATQHGIRDAESWWGVVYVADAMARLNREVVAAFLGANLPVIGVQPSASALASGGKLTRIEYANLATLMQARLIPVIYGDVVLDRVQGCAIISTEALFAALATELRPARIVLVGEEGVYDADPRQNPAAQPIRQIDRSNYASILHQLSGSHGVDVTGGMQAKVTAMWELAQAAPALEIVICGPQALAAALCGNPLPSGTTIRALT